MPFIIWLCALAAVALSAAAQLLMKIGMAGLQRSGSIAGSAIETILRIVSDPWVIGGLVSYGASSALWLAVLSRAPLSLAYPLTALGISVVVIASWLFLREPIGPARLGGILMILSGVILIGIRV